MVLGSILSARQLAIVIVGFDTSCGTERLSIGVRLNVVTHVATVVWRAIWAE